MSDTKAIVASRAMDEPVPSNGCFDYETQSIAAPAAALEVHQRRSGFGRRPVLAGVLRKIDRGWEYAWLRLRGFTPRPANAILDTPWWRRGSESNRRTRLCRPLHFVLNQKDASVRHPVRHPGPSLRMFLLVCARARSSTIQLPQLARRNARFIVRIRDTRPAEMQRKEAWLSRLDVILETIASMTEFDLTHERWTP
jgi:hypothetical protein